MCEPARWDSALVACGTGGGRGGWPVASTSLRCCSRLAPGSSRWAAAMRRRTMADAIAIDPRVFDPSAVDPETAAFNAQLEAQLAAAPGWYEPESAPALRALSEGLLRAPAVSPLAEERTLPGPHG